MSEATFANYLRQIQGIGRRALATGQDRDKLLGSQTRFADGRSAGPSHLEDVLTFARQNNRGWNPDMQSRLTELQGILDTHRAAATGAAPDMNAPVFTMGSPIRYSEQTRTDPRSATIQTSILERNPNPHASQPVSTTGPAPSITGGGSLQNPSTSGGTSPSMQGTMQRAKGTTTNARFNLPITKWNRSNANF